MRALLKHQAGTKVPTSRDLHGVPETKKTRPEPNRLKPEIGSGSGLKTNYFRVQVGFRVSTFLFGSGSG